MAFAVKNDLNSGPSNGITNGSNHNKGQRKERPFCTHYNYHGIPLRNSIKYMVIPMDITDRSQSLSIIALKELG